MSYLNAFARLDLALAALRRRFQRSASSELIRFINKDGSNCVCLVVRRKIGRQRHVAFVSVAGSPNHPAASIEGLASSAFRELGAPAASLVFWFVDRHEWDDGITIQRVEFLSLAAGKFSGPQWIAETLPGPLLKQVALARPEIFSAWPATAPGGPR